MSRNTERDAFIQLGWRPSRRWPEPWRNGDGVEPAEREPEENEEDSEEDSEDDKLDSCL